MCIRDSALALAVASQHHVVDYIHVADESHAESVLGDERQAHAELADMHRRLVAQVVLAAGLGVVVHNLAAVEMLKSCDGFKQLALTASGDTRDAENLARTRGERDVVKKLDSVAVDAADVLDLSLIHI